MKKETASWVAGRSTGMPGHFLSIAPSTSLVMCTMKAMTVVVVKKTPAAASILARPKPTKILPINTKFIATTHVCSRPFCFVLIDLSPFLNHTPELAFCQVLVNQKLSNYARLKSFVECAVL